MLYYILSLSTIFLASFLLIQNVFIAIGLIVITFFISLPHIINKKIIFSPFDYKQYYRVYVSLIGCIVFYAFISHFIDSQTSIVTSILLFCKVLNLSRNFMFKVILILFVIAMIGRSMEYMEFTEQTARLIFALLITTTIWSVIGLNPQQEYLQPKYEKS